jgi:hypothetical protein
MTIFLGSREPAWTRRISILVELAYTTSSLSTYDSTTLQPQYPKKTNTTHKRETNKRDNKRINDLSILTTENNDTHRHTYQVSRRKTIRNPTKEKQTNLKEERLIIRRERERRGNMQLHPQQQNNTTRL